jgi:hypothetical protein
MYSYLLDPHQGRKGGWRIISYHQSQKPIHSSFAFPRNIVVGFISL